jgi:hypothetical protein
MHPLQRNATHGHCRFVVEIESEKTWWGRNLGVQEDNWLAMGANFRLGVQQAHASALHVRHGRADVIHLHADVMDAWPAADDLMRKKRKKKKKKGKKGKKRKKEKRKKKKKKKKGKRKKEKGKKKKIEKEKGGGVCVGGEGGQREPKKAKHLETFLLCQRHIHSPTAVLVLVEEIADGALVAQRVQQLNLGVAEVHKHGGHAVLRQRLGRKEQNEKQKRKKQNKNKKQKTKTKNG